MSNPGKIIKLECDTCRYHDNPDWVCTCKDSKLEGQYTAADDFCKEWWWKDEKIETRVPVWGKKTDR